MKQRELKWSRVLKGALGCLGLALAVLVPAVQAEPSISNNCSRLWRLKFRAGKWKGSPRA